MLSVCLKRWFVNCCSLFTRLVDNLNWPDESDCQFKKCAVSGSFFSCKFADCDNARDAECLKFELRKCVRWTLRFNGTIACSHDTERTFSVPEIWTEWSHCISTASGTLTGFNLHMHAFPLQCLLSVFSLSAGSLSACFFWPARFLNIWNSNCLKVELPF